MRRKDREVLGLDGLLAIMDKCETMTLSMVDEGKPYAVTVNFGVVKTGDNVEVCFHCAKEGRKLEVIRKNPNVSFTMVSHYKTKIHDSLACKWSAWFESAYGEGLAQFVPEGEKDVYLDAIMKKLGYDGKPEYDTGSKSRAEIVTIKVSHLTGKSLVE